MKIEVVKVGMEGLLLIETKVFQDARGFFMERYHRRDFSAAGLSMDFVQDNHSRSTPGVVRGIQYQHRPSQGKLVGVTHGRIWDLALDLRAESPSFGKYYGCELSAENGRLLWIPGGFAHGFCVIGEEPADVVYKVTEFYDPKREGGIHCFDPELRIPWPAEKPEISDRDQELGTFADYRRNPIFNK